MIRRGATALAVVAVLAIASSAAADDDFTLYELLDPASASFRITYDVT